jgi:predicted  nucleic acid-binding Zn-ribbon protein
MTEMEKKIEVMALNYAEAKCFQLHRDAPTQQDAENIEEFSGLMKKMMRRELETSLQDVLKIRQELEEANEHKVMLNAQIDKLDQELEEARKLLKLAEETFRHYGDLHVAKPDEVKAKRNYELADTMAKWSRE